jgi:hypothetical protein
MKMIFSILENVDVESELGDYLKSVLIEKLNKILGSISAEYDLETLKGIEEKFKFNIFSLLNENSKLEILKDCIERIYVGLADDYYDLNTSEIFEEVDFNKAVDSIWEIQFNLSSKYFNDTDLEFEYNPIVERGFDEIVDSNMEAQFDASREWQEKEQNNKDYFDIEVESLFNRFYNKLVLTQ